MALSSFATEVLADGPIGYWRLGEAPGQTTATDASGQGNNGAYATGGVTLGLPGFNGGDTAALFDGATGRIVVPNSATLNPARITMEAKVRWDGPTGLQQRILEKESFAGTTQYGLSILPDGHVYVELRMRVPGSPVIVSATSTGLAALGAETHVVATYDGQAIAIYRDGVLDSATTVPNPADIDTKWPHIPPDDPEVALAIGDRIGLLGNPPTHRTFHGLIDEVALYATPLAADRVLAHYRSQFAPDSSCFDNPDDVFGSDTCVTSLSKDVKGRITLSTSKRHVCAESKCVTLRTQGALKVTLASHPPCDGTLAQLLSGTLAIRALATAYENDGLGRGVHAGDFRWVSANHDEIDGRISGITNAGLVRGTPFDPAVEECSSEGILVGRLCGRIVRSANPQLAQARIVATYRLRTSATPKGEDGAVIGTLEGVVVTPC